MLRHAKIFLINFVMLILASYDAMAKQNLQIEVMDDEIADLTRENDGLSTDTKKAIEQISNQIEHKEDNNKELIVIRHGEKLVAAGEDDDLGEVHPLPVELLTKDTKKKIKVSKDKKKKAKTIIKKAEKKEIPKQRAKAGPREDFPTTKVNGLNLSIGGESKSEFIVEEMLEDAYVALNSGQTEVASTLYKNVLNNDANNVSALFGLATIYHQNSQLEEARALYTNILSLEPSNQDALNNFLMLVGEESPEEAILELKKLEAINPTVGIIPAQIAMIYLRQGEDKKALKYFNKAILLAPDNLVYRYNLAILLDKMGDGLQAIGIYKQLIEASLNGATLPDSADKLKQRVIYLSSKF
jgi:Tfp pilus assembly protein PilF